MISRTVAESVFALMDARGINPAIDVVCINLYNSGPTLHVEPACLLRAFAADGPMYVDGDDLHAIAEVDGVRVVAICSQHSHMDQLRACGRPLVPFFQPESSEVAF
jgi:hypothetical protein